MNDLLQNHAAFLPTVAEFIVDINDTDISYISEL